MRASTLLETSLVILMCTQYVSYDKTILVGNGHTWRAAPTGALLS